MESKNNMWGITLAILITAVVVGGGVYWWQQSKLVREEVVGVATSTIDTTTVAKEESREPLTYSTIGVSTTVSKETRSFGYTAEELVSLAEECGNNQTKTYFSNLVAKFGDVTRTVYSFKYTGPTQQPDMFAVTLLPNKAGYSSLEEFKKDFDQCYAGGDAYPAKLNSDWLLFVSSCGTGFDDGSGRPVGCQEVQDVVVPTFKFN